MSYQVVVLKNKAGKLSARIVMPDGSILKTVDQGVHDRALKAAGKTLGNAVRRGDDGKFERRGKQAATAS